MVKRQNFKTFNLFKTSKKKCWVSLSDSCLNAISLDQLTPADEVRRLVEDFKGGGTLYKEKNNPSEEVPVVNDPAEESLLDPAIIVKQEPVDFPSSEVIFSSDSSLAAKIAQKSAELRARLAQCKLSGGADVGGEVSEKADFRTENEQDAINDNVREDDFRSNKHCETNEEEYSKKSLVNRENIPECGEEYGESNFKTESMETSQNDSEYDDEEYGESILSKEPMGSSQNVPEYEDEEYGESTLPDDTEEYSEGAQHIKTAIKSEHVDPSSSKFCLLCHKPDHDLSSCPEVKCKSCGLSGHALFNCPDKFSYSAPNSVESALSGEQGNFSPKKEPGLCTPTSSGYWSDDAKEGPYFGKLRLDLSFHSLFMLN